MSENFALELGQHVVWVIAISLHEADVQMWQPQLTHIHSLSNEHATFHLRTRAYIWMCIHIYNQLLALSLILLNTFWIAKKNISAYFGILAIHSKFAQFALNVVECWQKCTLFIKLVSHEFSGSLARLLPASKCHWFDYGQFAKKFTAHTHSYSHSLAFSM